MRPGFELDHIAIAVTSLEEGFEFYRKMGWKKYHTEIVEQEKVKVAFIEFENNVDIELVEPTSADSVVKKFLDKRGSGIHHICFRVKKIDDVLKKLKSEGVRLVNETAFTGAKNCRVAFVHPSSANGVLIELSEPLP